MDSSVKETGKASWRSELGPWNVVRLFTYEQRRSFMFTGREWEVAERAKSRLGFFQLGN